MDRTEVRRRDFVGETRARPGVQVRGNAELEMTGMRSESRYGVEPFGERDTFRPLTSTAGVGADAPTGTGFVLFRYLRSSQ